MEFSSILKFFAFLLVACLSVCNVESCSAPGGRKIEATNNAYLDCLGGCKGGKPSEQHANGAMGERDCMDHCWDRHMKA